MFPSGFFQIQGPTLIVPTRGRAARHRHCPRHPDRPGRVYPSHLEIGHLGV